jgi:hypothetical protein
MENADKCAWQFGDVATDAKGRISNVMVGGAGAHRAGQPPALLPCWLAGCFCAGLPQGSRRTSPILDPGAPLERSAGLLGQASWLCEPKELLVSDGDVAAAEPPPPCPHRRWATSPTSSRPTGTPQRTRRQATRSAAQSMRELSPCSRPRRPLDRAPALVGRWVGGGQADQRCPRADVGPALAGGGLCRLCCLMQLHSAALECPPPPRGPTPGVACLAGYHSWQA